MLDHALKGSLRDYRVMPGTDLLDRFDPFFAWQDLRRQFDLWPYAKSTATAPKTSCTTLTDSGKSYSGVNFASQDYLSLASHPDVKRAERKTIETALKMGLHPRVELADIKLAAPYLEMGVKHFCIGWDVRVLHEWWRVNGEGMRTMLTGDKPAVTEKETPKTY